MKTSVMSFEKIGYGLIKVFTACFLTLMLVLTSCQKYDDIKPLEDPNVAADLKSASEFCKPHTDDNSAIIYYGHKIFKRSWGAPVVVVQTITNPDFDCFDEKFVLKIRNGLTKFTRVSSGEIWIDGVLVVRPSDFSKNVSMITKSLTGLKRESVLEVKLNGAPGTFIDLWIEGTKKVITPAFEQIGPLCQNSTAPELPLSSTNTPVITGTWNPETINTAIVGKATYTFTPSEGKCSTPVKMEIEITPLATPTFTQIGPFEQNSVAPGLPAVSNNGITGTWNPGTISTAKSGTFTYTFTPAAGQCATDATMIIEVTNSGSVLDIEGNVYKTVKIGDQWWMAENLKTTKYNDGISIPLVTDNSSWAAGQSAGYCWYNNEIENKSYGALYNGLAVSSSRICPTGWHVALNADWQNLFKFLGGSGSAGGKLKESGTVHWSLPNTGATNEVQFSALPGGFRSEIDGKFFDIKHVGSWWSSYSSPQLVLMFYNEAGAYFTNRGSGIGLSIRCVMD